MVVVVVVKGEGIVVTVHVCLATMLVMVSKDAKSAEVK